MAFDIYTLTGAYNDMIDAVHVTGDNPTASLVTAAGGALVGAGAAATVTAFTWTGVGTEDYDNAADLYTAAHVAPTVQSNALSVGLTSGSTSETFSVVSWRKSLISLSGVEGVLARKAGDQLATNYSTPAVLTWDENTYSSHTLHDVSSNTSRITIPSSLNGRIGILRAGTVVAAFTSASNGGIYITKGGSVDYVGFGGYNKLAGALGGLFNYCRTQPLVLTTGDYFEVMQQSSDTSVTIDAVRSYFSLEIVG